LLGCSKIFVEPLMMEALEKIEKDIKTPLLRSDKMRRCLMSGNRTSETSTLFDCDITLDDYLLKSYYKTASLIAASTKSAAIFSGVSTTICEKMYAYGRNLGLSFQVVDDMLDFTQSAEQLGKPAASDLAKGNLTAPVIFALQSEPELREIIDSEFSDTDSLAAAIELVHRSGGIRRAHELAREKGDLAIQNLQCLPRSDFRSALEKMVEYNLERID
jgi:all-trans-nonaprenyl-diphosphate synthase